MLEQHKFVTRTVTQTVPPATEYALTEHGCKIEGVLAAMAEFGSVVTAANALR